MTYPADVQAALDHAGTEGWTVERYQAVLAIALHHLAADPPMGEVLVQYAEASIQVDLLTAAIEAGEICLVCPDCGLVSEWSVVTDGSEYAPFSPKDLVRGEGSDFTGDADYFLCGSCGVRFAVPDWLWEAGWFDGDAVEWGELVTD